jgi:hypothetical protein
MSNQGYGDVVIRGHWPTDAIEVLEAAPRTLISDQLLTEIRNGASPHATLDGDLLTIRAVNRTVVYRIIGRHPDWLNHPNTWVMEWPD